MRIKEVQLLAILAIIAASIIGLSIWGGQNSTEQRESIEHRRERTEVDTDKKEESIQITSKDLDNFLSELSNRPSSKDLQNIIDEKDDEAKNAEKDAGDQEPQSSSSQTALLSPHIPSEDHLRRPPGHSTEDELALTAPEDIPLQASSKDSAVNEEKGSDEKVTYTVQRGDTLGQISVYFYGTASKWQDILDSNSKILRSPRHLREGMELVIPNISEKASDYAKSETSREKQAPTSESASVSRNAVRHTVQKGEYLSTISQKYYNTAQKVNKIIEANDSIDNPDDIKAGVTIIIPEVKNSEITQNENPSENSQTLLSAQRVTNDEGITYIVKRKDTLWSLANHYYDDPKRYVDIIEANEHLSSPKDIAEGMEILIPE